MCSIGKGKPMIGFRYVSLPSLCCLPNKYVWRLLRMFVSVDVAFYNLHWLYICVLQPNWSQTREACACVLCESGRGPPERDSQEHSDTRLIEFYAGVFIFSYCYLGSNFPSHLSRHYVWRNPPVRERSTNRWNINNSVKESFVRRGTLAFHLV